MPNDEWMQFHYQTTANNWEIQFSEEADKPFRSCKFSTLNSGHFNCIFSFLGDLVCYVSYVVSRVRLDHFGFHLFLAFGTNLESFQTDSIAPALCVSNVV